MPTIPNKRRETIAIPIIAGAGGAVDVMIPNSEHYTRFAVSIPNVSNNFLVTVIGVAGTGCNGDTTNPAVVDDTALPLIRQGISSTAQGEIALQCEESATNIFDTVLPLPGGIGLRLTNNNAGATAPLSVSVMMYGSAYSASL